MKTRYKIFIIIASTAGAFMAMIPIVSLCPLVTDECTLVREVFTSTRPTIQAGLLSNYEIESWSTQGIEEFNFLEHLDHNTKFIFSMIVIPSLAILGLLVWEKRTQIQIKFLITGLVLLAFGLSNVFLSVFHTISVLNQPFPFLHTSIEIHENGIGVGRKENLIEAVLQDPYWIFWSLSFYAGIFLLISLVIKSRRKEIEC